MKESTCKKQDCKTTVSCGAKECVHNEAEKCVADHIDIGGSHASSCRETECDTFCR